MIRTWSYIEEGESSSTSSSSASPSSTHSPTAHDSVLLSDDMVDPYHLARLVQLWRAAEASENAHWNDLMHQTEAESSRNASAARLGDPSSYVIPDEAFSDTESADFPDVQAPWGASISRPMRSSSSSDLNLSDDDILGTSPEFHSPMSGGTSYHTAPNTPQTPDSPAPEGASHSSPLHPGGPEGPPPFPAGNASLPPQPTSLGSVPIDELVTLTSLLPSHKYHVRCWQYPRDRALSPVFPNPGDCIQAMAFMLHGDKANAPINFSMEWGFRMPHRWVWNTCSILIRMDGDRTVVTTTMKRIADAAGLLVEHCIDFNADTRGGLFKFGEMWVIVTGRVPGGPGQRDRAIGSESYTAGRDFMGEET